MPDNKPIGPCCSSKSAFMGRIVCMDEKYTVIQRGIIYIDKSNIVDIKDAAAPIPDDFKDVEVIDTKGTIYPGLIELHNHLSYNALRLWNVPKKYSNRDQWAGTSEYQSLITGPMKVLGQTPELLPALVRYVEAKCLLGGVTTSQGIQLASNAGIRKFYRGIVRNVEQTDEIDLPEATTKIADVDTREVSLFYKRLKEQNCLLLHLSEGVDEKAREHFLALKIDEEQWAICKKLVGIHAAGLNEADFRTFAKYGGGGIIWSPMSNLLLYGGTANIKAAKENGIRIGIGSDWSPSGSKNLLGELKVAKLYSENNNGILSDRDIVSMATREAGFILGWEKVIGTLEPGKRADILVLKGKTSDPYKKLISAGEKDISLIMINGVARYGLMKMMKSLVPEYEKIKVGGVTRTLYLSQNIQEPEVEAISLSVAEEKLKDALNRLPELALALEQPQQKLRTLKMKDSPESYSVVWTLALDELMDTGVELRHRLSTDSAMTGPQVRSLTKSKPLSQVLKPLKLDPLTITDDEDYIENIQNQKNLPDYIKEGLKKMY